MPSPTSVLDALKPEQQREVSIFWDYEDLQLPSWANAADAAKALVNKASEYGRIVDRRLYLDFSGADGDGVWSALDSSGFDLVKTTHKNQRETLDKKLIADVLTFAWDSTIRNAICKPCVVLLTRDGDYAYTLSKLRDRGVMVMLVTPTAKIKASDLTGADLLKASAHISLSLEDILMERKDAVGKNSPLQPDELTNVFALALCKVVAELQNNSRTSETQNWVLGSKIGLPFRNAIKDICNANGTGFKERYKEARTMAVKNKWLLQGRRILVGSNKGQIVGGNVNSSSVCSKEDYMCLTSQGKAALEKVESNSKSKSSCLFIKNVPRNSPIIDLVRYLEQEYKCVVLRCNTEKGPPMTSYCFARVQLEDPEDAEKLILLSKASKLKLNDRLLQVSYDKTLRQYSGDPTFTYDGYRDRENTFQSQIDSPSEASRGLAENKKLECIDGALILCTAIRDFANDASAKSDKGWLDGGGIAAKFKLILKKYGKLRDGSCDKDRFKEARADAIARNLIETGRRARLPDRSGVIEKVTKASPNAQYTKELYIRLTEKGHEIAQQHPHTVEMDISCSNVDSKDSLNVFIKMVPMPTTLRELVWFLEKEHDCYVRRASMDSVHAKSNHCNAHVELGKSQDAVRIIQLASASDGLIYKGKNLTVVPDERVPTEHGDDPLIFYDNSGHDPFSTAESTKTLPFVSSPGHQFDCQVSNAEALNNEDDGTNDKSLFCAVIYAMCSNGGAVTAWVLTGLVFANFQKHVVTAAANNVNELFMESRDEVISGNFVEMGRRQLDPATKQAVVAPYSSASAMPKDISSKTYLRLTEKGVTLARGAIASKRHNILEAPPKTSSTTIFLSNLPRGKTINELVEHIENTFQVKVTRALMDSHSAGAKVFSAHIEFESAHDSKTIFDASTDKTNTGLTFCGKTLRAYPDRNIPDWSKCNPRLLYCRKEGEKKLFWEKKKGFDLEQIWNASICDTTADSTTADSESSTAPGLPLNDRTSHSFEDDAPSKLENLDTTELLFGDNLALLYAQTAGYNDAEDAFAILEKPPVPIPILENAEATLNDAVVFPIGNGPDLIW